MFRSSLIGLDIQPEALYLVQLQKKKHFVQQALSLALPEGIFSSEGKIVKWNNLRAILKELVDQHHLHGSKTAIALPINLTHMQQITLPNHLSEMEIEEAIDSQIKRTVPMQESLCIDFSITSSLDNKLLDIFFVATREEDLSQYVNCIEDAGLIVKVVDVDVYALARGAQQMVTVVIDSMGNHELMTKSKATLTVGIASTHIVNNIISILYLNLKMTILTLIKNNKIIFYQRWYFKDELELYMTLKEILPCYLDKQETSLNQVIFCGSVDYFNEMAEFVENNLKLTPCFLNTPFRTTHLMSDLTMDRQNLFVIAIGLALRELPKW